MCSRESVDVVEAFRFMVAWPPSGPTTVVIVVVDYISELTIHSLYVHPLCVKEMYNTSFIVSLMQQIVHSWYRPSKFRTVIIHIYLAM